jgi:anti-anti-sigma factor
MGGIDDIARMGPAATSPPGPDMSVPVDEPGGPLRVSDYGGELVGLRLAGEIDLVSHTAWEQALRRLAGQAGEVHLDCSGLRFIDAQGTALLVHIASQFAHGQRIVLHDPPPCLKRVLEVLWPAGVPMISIGRDAA